jgi:hypothetical protein
MNPVSMKAPMCTPTFSFRGCAIHLSPGDP